MKPIRSFLFVPGNKASWIEKSVAAKADALILDLEDSVPPDHKVEARGIVQSKLAWLAEQKQRTWVRINRSPHLYDFDDILAIVGPHVEGIVISKPCGPEDIDTVSSMLSEAEYRTRRADRLDARHPAAGDRALAAVRLRDRPARPRAGHRRRDREERRRRARAEYRLVGRGPRDAIPEVAHRDGRARRRQAADRRRLAAGPRPRGPAAIGRAGPRAGHERRTAAASLERRDRQRDLQPHARGGRVLPGHDRGAGEGAGARAARPPSTTASTSTSLT